MSLLHSLAIMDARTIFVLILSLVVTLGSAKPADVDCDDGIICTAQYLPVCGSDGKTYGNACNLKAERCHKPNLREQCKGECPCQSQDVDCDDGIICTAQYLPVCGSDGKTYGNACNLKAERCHKPNLREQCKGECPCQSQDLDCDDIACTTEYFPVCGSDGKTYSNACQLDVASCRNPDLTEQCKGQCPCPSEEPECNEICTLEYDPVCGSDGMTYGNACTFEAASCHNKSLTEQCKGECPCASEDLDCDDIACTADYSPVCGSDGKTYSNACQLDVASCRNPDLGEQCKGECPCATNEKLCKERILSGCPSTPTPICASNGKTYNNTCILMADRLCMDRSLTINCARECPCECTWACPAYINYVCGSDGVSYLNICELVKADCLHGSTGKISAACIGSCPCDDKK